MNTEKWEVPKYKIDRIKEKSTKYCLCIPIINEGDKIVKQLQSILDNKVNELVDVIICDGGSTDGSTELEKLKNLGVCTLLTKQDTGKLSAQLRMGYSFAITEGYAGVITVDGNGKDDVTGVKLFVDALDQGWDFIQGSRYVEGGQAINTPLIRHVSVKLIHAPIISMAAKFKYTDTTNGYRGYSNKMLLDERVQPFRKIFNTYELLAYLSVRAPELGFKTKEVPVTRRYPKTGKTPTKISFFKGNSDLMKILINSALHKYDPEVNNG